MNVLIVTLGSHGDVHPFLGIAQVLRRRGHRVTFFASVIYTDLLARLGIDFVPLGTSDDFYNVARDPDVWHKTRSLQLLGRYILAHLPDIYQTLVDHLPADPGERPRTVLVHSTLALAARIVQEKHGIRAATVHLSPSLFRSAIESPRLPGLYMPGWMPAWSRRTIFQIIDRFVIDRAFCPSLNAFRATLGLVPMKGVMATWWHSPDRVIGMFPDWYARPQSDWPKQTRLTGFPLFDERDVTPMPGGLQAFCEVEKPIVFTPGSANLHGGAFFLAAAQACAAIGRRGILLTRHPEQIPQKLPPSVIHVPYVPFSQLLPRAAALVHHGGIGTTSQALAAGTPQLIMRLSHDQYDNARRVRRLNAGMEIAPRQFTGKRVARTLETLLASDDLARGARQVARRFHDRPDPLEQTADWVEELVPDGVGAGV